LYYIGVEKNKDAHESLNMAISLEKNSNSAHTFTLPGDTLVVLENTDEAILNYEKAITIEPEYITAYGPLSNALRLEEKYDEAVKV
jgi:tetratricopeptide (TPR) repeat protein